MTFLRSLVFSSFIFLFAGLFLMPQVQAATFIKAVSFQDLNHIVIQLNEAILSNTAQDKNNYSIIDLNQKHPVITDIITIHEATYNTVEKTVTLWITGSIVQIGESYQLHTENLKDNQGNIFQSPDTTFEQGSTTEPAYIDISFSKASHTLPNDEFTLITVIAKDKNNLPLANIPIGFEIISGKGDLSKVGSENTNEEGKVIATYIPESKKASHMIRAFVKSSPNISTANSIEVQLAKTLPITTPVIEQKQDIESVNSSSQPTSIETQTPTQGKVLAATDSLPQTGINIMFYIFISLFGAFLIERRIGKRIQYVHHKKS